jgi:acyl dehydratase
MTTIVNSPRDLMGMEDTQLGPSNWLTVDQKRIDGFADVTGDHQWIHVDPERAKSGPFGKTIAHGYLTLALVNTFLPELIDVRGFSLGVNIGVDTVRFLGPVPVDSRIRAGGEIVGVGEVKAGPSQAGTGATGEMEAQEKRACDVDTISRYVPE